MIRRILTALTAITFVLLAFASPHSAQERQVVEMTESEKLRSDLLALYDESKALIDFMAGYDVIRQSEAMKSYDAIRQKLSERRLQIEQMSAAGIMAQADFLPDRQALNRAVKISRSVRTDERFQEAMRRAERYIQAGLKRQSSLSAPRNNNSRGVIAAPAYIPPVCDFDDPSAYPSGVDAGILGGIGIALHAVADALPNETQVACTMVPFIPRIILVIVAGAFDIYKNLVDTGSADAAYCEKVRFYIEDKLKDDRGITTLWVADDFYLTFMLKSVRASLSAADGVMVPTNCGNARLAEAEAYFSGDNFNGTGPQRVDAYKRLRAAYQNIGASACVP